MDHSFIIRDKNVWISSEVSFASKISDHIDAKESDCEKFKIKKTVFPYIA